MYVAWPLVVLLAYTTRLAHGFGSGAPPAGCDNMIPAHRRNGQPLPSRPSPSPYRFQVQASTYTPGQPIKMRLMGQQGAYFKGFLIKVVTSQGEAVGRMIPPSGYKAITCGLNGNEALTHTEKSPKGGVEFTWTAPSTSYGQLTVRATYVYNYDTFWVNEIQATLDPVTTTLDPVTTTVSPPMTPVPVLTTTSPPPTKSPILIPQTQVNPVGNLTSIFNRFYLQNVTVHSGEDYLLSNNATTNNSLEVSDESLKGDTVTRTTNLTDNTTVSSFIQNVAASVMLSRISNLADNYSGLMSPDKNESLVNDSFESFGKHFVSVLDTKPMLKDTSNKDKQSLDNYDNESMKEITTISNQYPIAANSVVNETLSAMNASVMPPTGISSVEKISSESKNDSIETTKEVSEGVSNVLSNKELTTRSTPSLNLSASQTTLPSYAINLETEDSMSAGEQSSYVPTDSTAVSHTVSSTQTINRTSVSSESFPLKSDTSDGSLTYVSKSSHQNTTQIDIMTAKQVSKTSSARLLKGLSFENNITTENSLPLWQVFVTTSAVANRQQTSSTQDTTTENGIVTLGGVREINMTITNNIMLRKINATARSKEIVSPDATENSTVSELRLMNNTKSFERIVPTEAITDNLMTTTEKVQKSAETININDLGHINESGTREEENTPYAFPETSTRLLEANSRKQSSPSFMSTTEELNDIDMYLNKTNKLSTTSTVTPDRDNETTQEQTVGAVETKPAETSTVAGGSLKGVWRSAPSFEEHKTTARLENFSLDLWFTSAAPPTDVNNVPTMPPIVAKTFRPATKRIIAPPSTTDVWLNMKPVPFTVTNLFKLLPSTRRVWLMLAPTTKQPVFIQPVFKAPPLPTTTTTTTTTSTTTITTQSRTEKIIPPEVKVTQAEQAPLVPTIFTSIPIDLPILSTQDPKSAKGLQGVTVNILGVALPTTTTTKLTEADAPDSAVSDKSAVDNTIGKQHGVLIASRTIISSAHDKSRQALQAIGTKSSTALTSSLSFNNANKTPSTVVQNISTESSYHLNYMDDQHQVSDVRSNYTVTSSLQGINNLYTEATPRDSISIKNLPPNAVSTPEPIASTSTEMSKQTRKLLRTASVKDTKYPISHENKIDEGFNKDAVISTDLPLKTGDHTTETKFFSTTTKRYFTDPVSQKTQEKTSHSTNPSSAHQIDEQTKQTETVYHDETMQTTKQMNLAFKMNSSIIKDNQMLQNDVFSAAAAKNVPLLDKGLQQTVLTDMTTLTVITESDSEGYSKTKLKDILNGSTKTYSPTIVGDSQQSQMIHKQPLEVKTHSDTAENIRTEFTNVFQSSTKKLSPSSKTQNQRTQIPFTIPAGIKPMTTVNDGIQNGVLKSPIHLVNKPSAALLVPQTEIGIDSTTKVEKVLPKIFFGPNGITLLPSNVVDKRTQKALVTGPIDGIVSAAGVSIDATRPYDQQKRLKVATPAVIKPVSNINDRVQTGVTQSPTYPANKTSLALYEAGQGPPTEITIDSTNRILTTSESKGKVLPKIFFGPNVITLLPADVDDKQTQTEAFTDLIGRWFPVNNDESQTKFTSSLNRFTIKTLPKVSEIREETEAEETATSSSRKAPAVDENFQSGFTRKAADSTSKFSSAFYTDNQTTPKEVAKASGLQKVPGIDETTKPTVSRIIPKLDKRSSIHSRTTTPKPIMSTNSVFTLPRPADVSKNSKNLNNAGDGSKTLLSSDNSKRKPQVEKLTEIIREGKIKYDPGCGFSKGCFVDCDSDGCKFMVTWQDVGDAVTFELYGKPKYTDGWIAVGFSKDSRMTDDSVTECVHSGGIVQAFNSYNPSYHNNRLNNSQIGLSDVSGSYYNGVLSCRFTRAKRVDTEPYMFDLEKDWNIMFAHGKAVPGFRISVHTDMPATSASRVDYQSFVVVGRATKFSLVKAHGCLMILAWVLFTGVGIVVARYYKNVWADKTFLKLKIWFQVHRSCMVTALVLDIIAFIIIFVDVKGYSQIPDIPGKTYLRSHPVLGIIVTILCVANPVMALFRPGPGDSKRPIFNWAHWGVGITAYILSALCICFGFQLGKASTPDYAVYIMIGYIIYVVLFDIACEVHDYLTRKEKKGKAEPVEMTTHNGTDNGIANGNSTNYTTKEKTKKSDKMKTILLAVHIAFTGAFALVLVLVVALN